MRIRRSLLATVTALILTPALAACSFEAGELEPVGEESETAESPDTESTGAELQTVTAEHLTAQVPADWQSMGDVDGWSYVHQLSTSSGGVAGRIGFMPGGAAMSAQEAVDWFISEVEGTGATDDDYAPVAELRTGEDRANTSYTYESGGERYTGVVWAISDGNGVPSLIQLSGAPDVVTPELIAQVDESLDVTGNWEGTTP
ncbi:hypothetical protein [Jiangella endophytica]|uniref:hypothetical protein n=1 Tax=Jiangella endophytica TaxID=1623398 RepID=UPI000E346E73|nr:hypothetical protein [Jiangella endophytica]